MVQHKPYYQPATTLHGFFFHDEQICANTEYLPHRHPWGQLIVVKSGVLALNIARQRFLAPPTAAVWLPADMEHSCYNRRQASARTINFADRYCAELPREPCLIIIGSVFNAIADDFFARGLDTPRGKSDVRLCHVLLDQLRQAPRQKNYLPMSHDKLLLPILQALEQNPADNTRLAQWARRVYSTERTLARRCQKALGMTFGEWRQRLRFLHAVSLLEQGMSVQRVALEVGYSSSSALNVLFQHMAEKSPEGYRPRAFSAGVRAKKQDSDGHPRLSVAE
ncbi:AraC family transcriptional regulator [Affinibrenneria salicis]|uniref:AraC family transcriptional regulator n=1 Tax=Affinibrenneria salicis TaxID=2590031 RepID=A0A5J5FTW9_9GAMM|nr:helix-turn-helix transcriptional regulator [Affinibrenneria salicis]KAA8996971.1 AraC family transcriptional regulator [Affinibrenneria salicis]